jgi:hypothetical protein
VGYNVFSGAKDDYDRSFNQPRHWDAWKEPFLADLFSLRLVARDFEAPRLLVAGGWRQSGGLQAILYLPILHVLFKIRAAAGSISERVEKNADIQIGITFSHCRRRFYHSF